MNEFERRRPLVCEKKLFRTMSKLTGSGMTKEEAVVKIVDFVPVDLDTLNKVANSIDDASSKRLK